MKCRFGRGSSRFQRPIIILRVASFEDISIIFNPTSSTEATETGVDMSLQTGVFLDLSFSNSKVSSLLDAENWNACKTHRTMSGRQPCFGKMGTLTSMITSLISPYLKCDFESKGDKGSIDWI